MDARFSTSQWFGRLPVRGMLDSSRLSWKAKLCYGVMTSFGPEFRASKSTVAARMSVSLSTVKEAFKELVEAGLIERLEEKTTHGTVVIPHYIVNEPSRVAPTRSGDTHPPVVTHPEGGRDTPTNREVNREEKQEGATVLFFRVASEYNHTYAERNTKHEDILTARATKYDPRVLLKAIRFYFEIEIYGGHGRTLNGFLNNMEKLCVKALQELPPPPKKECQHQWGELDEKFRRTCQTCSKVDNQSCTDCGGTKIKIELAEGELMNAIKEKREPKGKEIPCNGCDGTGRKQ